MELLSNKDRILQLVQGNHDKLSKEIGSLLQSLEFSAEHQAALVNGDLTSPTGIAASTEACMLLEERLASPIPTGLDNMSAVMERRKEWDDLRRSFCKRFTNHINNLFIQNVSPVCFLRSAWVPVTINIGWKLIRF